MMGKVHDPAPSRADDEVIDKAWVFVREYLNVSPDALFDAARKSLEDTRSFKVWKVDDVERFINLTTHSLRLDPKVRNHQVEVDLQVVAGKDPASSVVNFRIIPTLTGIVSQYELFTNADVNAKFARLVADLIFGAIAASSRKS